MFYLRIIFVSFFDETVFGFEDKESAKVAADKIIVEGFWSVWGERLYSPHSIKRIEVMDYDKEEKKVAEVAERQVVSNPWYRRFI